MTTNPPLLMAVCLFSVVGISQQSRALTVQGSPSGDAHVNLVQPQSADDGAPTGQSASDIAKELQNPIGTIISVPFQNNINFNVGPHKDTQDILNIQPVIPFPISDYWNLITRTIAPLIWNPSFEPASSVPFGLGPISFSAFLSPKEPVDGWVWGVTLTALHAIDAPVHKTGVESSAPGANVLRDIIIRAEQCDPRPQGCRCRSKSTFFQGIH